MPIATLLGRRRRGRGMAELLDQEGATRRGIDGSPGRGSLQIRRHAHVGASLRPLRGRRTHHRNRTGHASSSSRSHNRPTAWTRNVSICCLDNLCECALTQLRSTFLRSHAGMGRTARVVVTFFARVRVRVRASSPALLESAREQHRPQGRFLRRVCAVCALPREYERTGGQNGMARRAEYGKTDWRRRRRRRIGDIGPGSNAPAPPARTKTTAGARSRGRGAPSRTLVARIYVRARRV